MALQGQTVDVLIQPVNQQAPETGGPIGRLRSLVNGVATRFQRGDQVTSQGTSLRIEKRDGFGLLTSNSIADIRDPATGTTNTAGKIMTAPQLLGSFRNQAIGVFKAAPFVFSDGDAAWFSPVYTSQARVLREKKIYQGNGVLTTPDSSRLGTHTLYVWLNPLTLSLNYTVIADDGTLVHATSVIGSAGTGTTEVKVTNDGARFWVVTRNFAGTEALTAIAVNASTGAQLGSLGVTTTANSYFDIAVNAAQLPNGVFVAQKSAIGQVVLQRFTWNGSTVTNSGAALAFALCATGRLAFLANDRNDGNLYLATVDAAGPFDHYVWQVTTPGGSPASGHQYNVTIGKATAAFQITGYVAQTGNADITVALAYLDTTPAPQLNQTEIKTVSFAGVTTLQKVRRSITPVSRPFLMDGSYYAVFYYRSAPAAFTGVAQSTYFLVNLAAPWQVCGRWEFGTAYADWNDTATVAWYMTLASVNADANGGLHVAMPYRASSSTAITLVGDVFTQARHSVDVLGLKEYVFGPDFGQSVDLGDEALLPGPQAVSFAGYDFSEDGIPLLTEVPLPPTQGGGGSLTALATYQYVFVWEWTNARGDRVRGPSGPPVNITLTGGNTSVTLSGYTLHVSGKQQILLGAYRTIMVNGVQSTQHYKVTGTLIGGAFGGPVIINDDTSNTWTFTDGMADTVAAVNEQLYTDVGLLDRFPAPPFSIGCRAFDRGFLVAPDNSIWFSGEKTEGDAFWWNPAQRILLPTHERVTAIVQLDNFLLVFCERSAVFSIPAGTFPDATGTGAVPTPTLLPFTNGCTGFTEVTDQGVMYSSTQGGIWLITRDLRNVFVGAPVQAETDGAVILGSASDDKQRVGWLTDGAAILVYDTVSGVWSKWASTGGFQLPEALTAHNGRFAFVGTDLGGNRGFCSQVLGQPFDVDNLSNPVAIITQVLTAFIRLGGIRNYKRIWEAQMLGYWMGNHSLSVTGYADEDMFNPTQVQVWTPASPGISGGPLIVSLPLKSELCSSVAFLIQDSFPGGPTLGFALEALSFYVGLEKGLGRLPAASSIKQT